METTAAETWHVLRNGLLILESRDPETGQTEFFQLQSTREVGPDDLRAHDARRLALMYRVARVWAPVLLVGRLLLWVCVAATVLGFVLGQLDATEVLGGWLFWVGLPLTIALWLPLKITAWRLGKKERSIELDAGFAPGMVDQVPTERARELIEAHGCRFTQARGTAQG